MKETMKAAVFEGEGKLVLKEVPTPKIRKPDDIIGKIEVCSICGTDVHMTNVPAGYPATPGTILGHELVATVAEIGSGVTQFQVGDRFVVNPNEYCGACWYCKNNLPNECETIQAMGIDVDGGFAEYTKVGVDKLVAVPEDMPDDVAILSEPFAVGYHVMMTSKIHRRLCRASGLCHQRRQQDACEPR